MKGTMDWNISYVYALLLKDKGRVFRFKAIPTHYEITIKVKQQKYTLKLYTGLAVRRSKWHQYGL
jgi:hypothetical protein